MNDSHGNDLLGFVESELAPVFETLQELKDKCYQENQGRIAWEISNAIRALIETVRLIKIYRSGEKLPTLAEIQDIYRQTNISPVTENPTEDAFYEKAEAMTTETYSNETSAFMFRQALVQELFGSNEPKTNQQILEAVRDLKLKREQLAEKVVANRE